MADDFAPVLTEEQIKKFDEVQARALDMIEADTGRSTTWDSLEQMYLLEDPQAPSAADDYLTLSMKPRLTIDQIQDILCAEPPRVVVPQLQDTASGREQAERIRVGLQAVIFKAEDQGDEIMPQLVAQAGVFGVAVLKVLDRRKLWKFRGLRPAQYEDEAFPFAFVPPHPNTIHVRRTDDVITAVLQRATVTGQVVADFFGQPVDWLDLKESKTQVQLLEYWDREWQCIWLEGEATPIIGPVQHKTRMPFCIRNVRSARFLGKRDRDGQSILRPLLDARTWRRMNLLLTALANNAYQMINTAYVMKSRDGKVPEGMDIGKAGAILPLFPDESLEPLRNGDIPENIKLLQMLLESDMDLALLAKVATGNAPGGVTAGFAVNILSQAARTKITSIQRAVERCYTDALQTVISYVRESGSVKIWGERGITELKAADFGDKYWPIEVKLSSSLPQDNIAKTQVAIAMKNLGVSQETILEDILGLSSEQELDRRWTEQFRDFVAPLRMMKAARKKGYSPTPEEEAWLKHKIGLDQLQAPAGAPAEGTPAPSQNPPIVGPESGGQGNPMQEQLMDLISSQAGRPPGGAEQPGQMMLPGPASEEGMM